MKVILHLEDCLDVLERTPRGSIDAFLFDPPYGLTGENGTTAMGYLGQEWDRSGVAFSDVFWNLVYNTLKPCGWVKAFCGTRTFHRMVVPMSHAGLVDIRLEAWCHGGSMPAGVNISLAVDALRLVGSTNSRALRKVTSMRPVVGYKTRQVSRGRSATQGESRQGVMANMERWLDSQAQRIPITAPVSDEAKAWDGWGTALKPSWEPVVVGVKP